MCLTFFLTAPTRAWCPSVQVLAWTGLWERPGLFQLPVGRILAALRAAGPTQLAAWARPACGARTGKAAAPPSHFEGTGVWWAEWPASDKGRKKQSRKMSCHTEWTYREYTLQIIRAFKGNDCMEKCKMQQLRMQGVRNGWVDQKRTSRTEETT